MANWRDRVRPTIILTSPDGEQFTGKWRRDNRSLTNKLGVFSYPGIAGNVVQPLGLNSMNWPITFFFDGADHDLVADRLMKAMPQFGPWAITHPIYGFHELSMISITEVMNPTGSGNIREFTSVWIEGIDPSTLKTAAEVSDAIGIRANLLGISSADQFVNGLNTAGAGNSFSISGAIAEVNAAINSVLGPITAANTAVQAEMNAIQSGIQDTLAAGILSPLALAGQMQALVETPLRAINDIKTRLNAYADLATAMLGIQPATDGSQTNSKGRNIALVQQIAMTSTISANAQIAATPPDKGGLISQKESVEAAVKINEQFAAITENLDESQTVFQDADIDDQHISQQNSHYDTAVITAQAIQFLFQSSFDLKKERRFRIKENRCPVEIAVVEYRGFGENDSNVDLFMDSNKLKGDRRLLLLSDTEVLIYA